jgi:hypothetical protein
MCHSFRVLENIICQSFLRYKYFQNADMEFEKIKNSSVLKRPL